MEDLQIWVYVIFGILYFLSRSLRKKPQEPQKQSPLETEGEARPQRRQPASFEELLREITEQREPQAEQKPQARKQEKQVSPKTATKAEDFTKEGSTRHFSDEQSRQVYEQSIKAAEGSKAPFERDEHFSIKLKEREKAEQSQFAKDIRDMLSNSKSAKKAIILGEILNRKY